MTKEIIDQLAERKITKNQAIHQLEVLLDNSTDIKDRLLANSWKHQLKAELLSI